MTVPTNIPCEVRPGSARPGLAPSPTPSSVRKTLPISALNGPILRTSQASSKDYRQFRGGTPLLLLSFAFHKPGAPHLVAAADEMWDHMVVTPPSLPAM